MTEPVTLNATHTHLFPGARLTTVDGPFPSRPGPVRILFRDDEEAGAELLPGGAGGELDLAVDAHRTAAGRDVPAKRWRVRIEADAAGAGAGVVGVLLRAR